MTSREDLGRLTYAAFCDMIGRPMAWVELDARAQAGWMHAAVTVRDRLQLGMSHAYRPDERQQEESTMALARSTAHGGSDEPHVTETDDADLYARQRAAGNDEIKWTGDGPAPGAEQTPEREALPAQRTGDDDGTGKAPAKRHIRPSASQRDKR